MPEIQIAVTKGKSTVTIDTDLIPQEVYAAALAEGLKAFVNKGMAKITTKGLTGTELEKAQAAAMKKARENADAILAGTIKLPGKKAAKGTSGVVMTEARRLAKNYIKDEIKRNNEKVSDYEAADITKAANALLETPVGKTLIETATANIAEREKTTLKGVIDISALISASPKLKAKNAEKRAKEKANAPLSATQAGKVAPKAKPTPAHA